MKMTKFLKIAVLLVIFSMAFSSSVYAYGTIDSGTFDVPPADDELAEGYAVYQVGYKYVVDESPKIAGVYPVVCSRGSKSVFHKKSNDGIPENYLTFASPTDKYISFTSDDENIASADKTAFYCNNVGRTIIHVDTGVYSPEQYKYNQNYEIIVYDVNVNGNGLKRQIAKTIDRAMSVLANGGEMPKFIDEKTAYILYDVMVTGKNINANLGVDLITADNVSNEHKSKIEKKLEKNDNLISYYDINIETSEENVEGVGYISELDDSIEVSVDLPSLPDIKEGYTRSFYAMRVHDDEVEKIDVSVVDGRAVFETDRFSTYALVYSDVVNIGVPDTGIFTKHNKVEIEMTLVSTVLVVTLLIMIIRRLA